MMNILLLSIGIVHLAPISNTTNDKLRACGMNLKYFTNKFQKFVNVHIQVDPLHIFKPRTSK